MFSYYRMCSLTTKCVLLLQVARYLDSTFYNMTTVTTHDWRTYEEMRTLAQDKYGVSLIETYLPTGKLWDTHAPLARVRGTRIVREHIL